MQYDNVRLEVHALTLQATVRTETVRCLEPLLHLPKALARSLPVTDVTALSPAALTDQRYSANGYPALPAADRGCAVAQRVPEQRAGFGCAGHRCAAGECALDSMTHGMALSRGPATG